MAIQWSERTDGARFRKTRFNKPINVLGKAQAFRREFNWLTLRMANMSKDHIEYNFAREGFLDAKIEKWPRLKSWGKRRPRGKKILVDTGYMKRTIGIKSRSRNRVEIHAPAPYSGYHNRPVGEMKGRLPGRQFMGHSARLAKATKKMIVTRLNMAAQV